MLVGTERWFSMLKNPDVSMVNLDCTSLAFLTHGVANKLPVTFHTSFFMDNFL